MLSCVQHSNGTSDPQTGDPNSLKINGDQGCKCVPHDINSGPDGNSSDTSNAGCGKKAEP